MSVRVSRTVAVLGSAVALAGGVAVAGCGGGSPGSQGATTTHDPATGATTVHNPKTGVSTIYNPAWNSTAQQNTPPDAIGPCDFHGDPLATPVQHCTFNMSLASTQYAMHTLTNKNPDSATPKQLVYSKETTGDCELVATTQSDGSTQVTVTLPRSGRQASLSAYSYFLGLGLFAQAKVNGASDPAAAKALNGAAKALGSD